MTKEEYIEKTNRVNREKEKQTRIIISLVKKDIERESLVEEHYIGTYGKNHLDKELFISELEKEYPFLEFTFSSDTIHWSLKK